VLFGITIAIAKANRQLFAKSFGSIYRTAICTYYHIHASTSAFQEQESLINVTTAPTPLDALLATTTLLARVIA
jgi:hypothetical protein